MVLVSILSSLDIVSVPVDALLTTLALAFEAEQTTVHRHANSSYTCTAPSPFDTQRDATEPL